MSSQLIHIARSKEERDRVIEKFKAMMKERKAKGTISHEHKYVSREHQWWIYWNS